MISEFASNPVLSADQVSSNAGTHRSCVFNAEVAEVNGEYLMVFRNDYGYVGGAQFKGLRGSVIFPCGMILENGGEVKIYCGAADTCVGLATAGLEDLLAAIEPLG